MTPRRPADRRSPLSRLIFVLLLALVVAEVGLRVRARTAGEGPARHWDSTLGWRARDAQDGRATTGVRLIALGDELTAGEGVARGERFTDVLEARVPGLAAVNLGCRGYGTDQEFLLLQHGALEPAPDLVVLVARLDDDLQDVRHEKRSGWPKPHFTIEEDELRLHPPARTWDQHLRQASLVAGWVLDRVDRSGRTERAPVDVVAPGLEHDDGFWLFARLVERMGELTRAADAHLLVVLVHDPQTADSAPSPLAGSALSALEQSEIAYLDTYELFHAALADGDLVTAADGTWTARGHELVGRTIATRLAREGWVPLAQ